MIFIVVKFTVRPDRTAEWLSLVQDFTGHGSREFRAFQGRDGVDA